LVKSLLPAHFAVSSTRIPASFGFNDDSELIAVVRNHDVDAIAMTLSQPVINSHLTTEKHAAMFQFARKIIASRNRKNGSRSLVLVVS